MVTRSSALALSVMMYLFSGMALSPTWSCSEDIFADAVDYGKIHYRLDEDLNSSWNDSPLYHESFGLFPACPAAVRSIFFSEAVITHEFDLEAEGGTVTADQRGVGQVRQQGQGWRSESYSRSGANHESAGSCPCSC